MDSGGNLEDDGSLPVLVGSGESRPRALSFRSYGGSKGFPGESEGCLRRSDGVRVEKRKPLVTKLTKDIVHTYQLCNPSFKYLEALNPKKYLTSPHDGVLNEGYDNENSDLVLSVNFELINEGSQQRYIVKEMLGQGTFGQVAKCWMPETNTYVAVKVIKNLPAYYHQAVHEVTILKALNQNFDPDKHHIVRMFEFFVYRRHLCISFEMLGSNLYELLKKNHLKGLPLSLVQMFSKQILHGLLVMKYAGIIHCDLKPENILLWTSVKPPGIKVIDFGSACKEDQPVYSYIQSRYYRSPEVLLGYPYTTAIDMWSFGCIIAELFLGLPLFPGASEYDLLKRMIEVIGGQPPDILLRDAKKTTKFFKHVGSVHHLDGNEPFRVRSCAYRLLTEEEYEAREQKKPLIGKWYFSDVKLEDIVRNYPYRRNLPEEEISKERLIRMAMIDFVRGLIEFDPEKRWTPLQASRHPFVTGEPFTQPYCPLPVTYHTPGIPNFRVDHGPEQGHWLASGLSPQVSNMSRGVLQSSPHFQMMPLSHGGSYGSWGSYGSYSDNACLATSYGDNNMHSYYSFAGPSGLSIPKQMGRSTLGSSPDARGVPQYSYGTGLGMSPTGTFRPMSLGVSPSQFTPPSSQSQAPNTSPGKYGPTSPAKSGSYGSALGKVAAVGQYNKRRSWGHPGTFPFQHQEIACQPCHGHHSDGLTCGCPEQNSQGLILSPRSAQSTQSGWRNDRGVNELTTGITLPIQQNLKPSHPGNSNEAKYSSESSSGKPESSSSSLDPGDWDPNYSDDLLLQEDSLDTSTMVSGINSMHLNIKMDPAILSAGSSRDRRGHMQAHSNSLDARTNGQAQMGSHANSRQSSFHDIHSGTGYNIPTSLPHHMAHHTQSSPSRFAQLPLHQLNPTSSTSIHGDRNCQRGQLMRPRYVSENPQSSPNIAFRGVTTWGQQAGHPIAAVLPSYRSRNDYGRIS